MRKLTKFLLILLALLVVVALATVTLLFMPASSSGPKATTVQSQSVVPSAPPLLNPISFPPPPTTASIAPYVDPTPGSVTYVHFDHWLSETTNPTDPNAPRSLTVYVSIVPGVGLATGNIDFALYLAGSNDKILPQTQASSSGATFDPSSSRDQSFGVSFLVPAQALSGTFVATLSSGGTELLRQSFSWAMTLPTVRPTE